MPLDSDANAYAHLKDDEIFQLVRGFNRDIEEFKEILEGKDDRALKEMIKRLSHKDSFDKLYVKMSEKLKGTSWQKEINQRLNSIQEDKNMKEILQEFAGPSAAANIDFSEYDVEKIATEILKTEDFQVPENIKKEIFEEWKEILSASGGGS